jgi:hypothetical protein
MMVAVAVLASLIGTERLWRRSQFYRKQAALCALFERQHRQYATDDSYKDDKDFYTESPDEPFDNYKVNMEEAARYKALKERYQRVYRHPWEVLPRDTPVSINPYDLQFRTASEIEYLVNGGNDLEGE